MDVLAIIPARGGSKSIPHKNLISCGGRPLVDWTIEAVNDSRLITRAILSSDDPSILARATGKVQPHLRAAWAATDTASSESVIEDALQVHRPDAIVMLQPTSPLTEGYHLDEALLTLLDGGYDSVISVVEAHGFTWLNGKPNYDPANRPRRQDMEYYEENGSFYCFTRELWERTKCRLGGKIGFYLMPEEHRVQIDSESDLRHVDQLLSQRVSKSFAVAQQ